MSAPRPRPGIMDIKLYVPGRSTVPGRSSVIKLSSNESALGPSPRVVAAYQDAAAKLHRYPDGTARVLREAIGARYGLDPARIICGAGSDELLYNIGRAYAGPGDEIVMSRHGFNMYPIVANSVGATLVMAPEANLVFDVDAVLACVTERTRIVFIANPNNPTGSYIPAEELRRLRDRLRDDILLVVDAAYAEYVVRNDYTPGTELVDAGANTVMTRTFSKIHALAALRVGWAYGPADVVDALNRIRGPFNVSTAAQAAAVAAIRDEAHVKKSAAHNAEWLAWLKPRIEAAGLKVYPSVGNFLLIEFPAAGAKTAQAADQFLMKRGVILRGVKPYGLPNCLRISVGTEEGNKAAVKALEEFMA